MRRVYILTIPMRLPSLNEIIDANRSSRYRGNDQKQNFTEAVAWTAKTGPRPIPELKGGPYRWRFTWLCADRRRDPDNIAAGVKFVFDGLKDAGVIANDGWRTVCAIEHLFFHDGLSGGVGEIGHRFVTGENDGVIVEAFL